MSVYFRGTAAWLCLLCLVGLFSAGCSSTEGPRDGRSTDMANTEWVQVVKDPHFQNGFELLAPEDGVRKVIDILDLGKESGQPSWTIAQWYTKFNLAGTSPQELVPGGIGYKDESKTIIVSSPGSEYADLVLGLNSGVEYDFTLRKDGEPWPHLLVSQRLMRDENLSLAYLEEVKFGIGARLLDVEKFKASEQDRRLHAAQFVIYLTVQNLNHQSEEYGNYYWFGIQLYDNRHLFSPEYIAKDLGSEQKIATGKMIFNPALTEFTKETLHSGDWVTIDKDILPLLLRGFNEGQKRGYISKTVTLNDYFIASVGMGWEIPGLFDISIQLRDISLECTYRVN
jgi:hypothetical protein